MSAGERRPRGLAVGRAQRGHVAGERRPLDSRISGRSRPSCRSATSCSPCVRRARRPDVARLVAGARFGGLYVDANAVAPATAREVGEIVGAAGADFVDGGIIGPPPREPGATRLYLAGPRAGEVAALFKGSALEAIVLPGAVGTASALKMAYAAWTKGSSALLLAVRALAIREGVDDALRAEWERSQPGLGPRSEGALAGNARKAWRFVGEMEEIAATFAAAGLPAGFHEACAAIYDRLGPYKDAPATPPMAEAAAKLSKLGVRPGL